jgi:predicted amidohydrolase YtcJ
VTRTLLRHGVVAAAAEQATALCVEDDRIVWVGDEAGADHFADNAEQVIDLSGGFVGPAFVDAHAHTAQTGLSMASLDLRGAYSCADALAALETYAVAHSGEVVLAFGWDETHWPEGRPFTGAEVDRAAGGRVAYLARIDVHSAVVSSAFTDRAPQVRQAEGWSADGRVERDAHHSARQVMNDLVSPGQRRDAIHRALQSAAGAGIGSVHELGAPHLSKPADFAAINELTSEQPLPFVVRYWGELGGVEPARELGCRGAAGDLCVDGAFGSRTAALDEPYADADSRTPRRSVTMWWPAPEPVSRPASTASATEPYAPPSTGWRRQRRSSGSPRCGPHATGSSTSSWSTPTASRR